MKNNLKWPLVAAVFCLIVIIGATKQAEKSPHELVTELYLKNMVSFKQSVKILGENVSRQKVDSKISNETAVAYLTVRSSFKRVEGIWEYIDPIFIKEYINGAPLPKLDKTAPSLLVIKPKGLQVIDELLFADTIVWDEVTEQISLLDNVLSQYQVQTKIYDRIALESIRMELIRLFTLGFTGFDVPGSGYAIIDAITVIQSQQDIMTCFKKPIENRNPKLWKEINEQLELTKKQLMAAKSFESLDRLSLLKNCINPLFESIHEAHMLLEIETAEEVGSLSNKSAINLNVKNIFSNDIINASYYTSSPKIFQNKDVETLGRLLFFDPILSANNERSCASCHNPQKGFTDGVPKSIATGMQHNVGRNSPTLLNCVYSERFFHDLRAEGLEDQMEHVVTSADEFNTNLLTIIGKLNESTEYKKLFDNAFKTTNQSISKQNISFALAAYVGSLHGFQSKFDQYVRGEISKIDKSVYKGFNLFMGKANCGTCHFAPVFAGIVPPNFNDSESEVLGVPENPYASNLKLDPDKGRAKGKLKEDVDFYEYSFKTPTIRNISLTAPYMHNGAYKTLEDVMDFYNNGGGAGMGIHVPYQTLSSDSLHLTKQEINDIIAFMQSLTDTANLTTQPARLPIFETHADWNTRKVGGIY
jgi:cytochrome c peroxidase